VDKNNKHHYVCHVGSNLTRDQHFIQLESTRMKIGTKVINKNTMRESSFAYSKTLNNGEVLHYFKDGSGLFELVCERALEDTYYFRIQNHPAVEDAARKKTVKKRTVSLQQPGERSIFESII